MTMRADIGGLTFVMLATLFQPGVVRAEDEPPTLPGLPDAHEKWMHEQFLAAGVAVAGIDEGEAYGSPRGLELFTALHRELTDRRGFAVRPCLLGRSRGGLWVTSWAAENPDKVAGLAGIYPVFDLFAIERARTGSRPPARAATPRPQVRVVHCDGVSVSRHAPKAQDQSHGQDDRKVVKTSLVESTQPTR
jgi:alpha-beta hydrolase superfamily lysophospholipase